MLDSGNQVVISSNLRNNNQWLSMGSFLAFLRDQVRAISSELVELLMGISWHIIPSFAKSRPSSNFLFLYGDRDTAVSRVCQFNLVNFVRSARLGNVFRNLAGVILCNEFPGRVFNHLLLGNRKSEVSGVCI